MRYDAAGNVTSRRLRDGTSIAYAYDDLNRVTTKTLPNSEPAVSYGYDNLSRLTSASQTGNVLSFTYDALSRLTDEAGPQGTVHSDWNADGTRSKVTYPGTGLYVNYDYLATGDILKIRENGATSGVGVLATYGYDDLGNRTSLTFGNTVLQTYAFDPVSRLQTLATTLAGTGNNLTIGGAGTPVTYNAASQITSAPRSNTAYSYTGYSAMNWPYTANGLNQYVTAGSPSNTLTYDPRGNLTTETSGGTTKNFGYSSENLMTSAPGATLSYDPLLRLYQVAGSTTTRFAYDGLNIIGDYNGSNALQHRYVFGAGTDAPIAEYDASGNRTFLSADERGSIIARTSSSGTLVATNTYDEYGIPGSANAGLFQYTGQAYIPQIGLYYYKARIYSPTSGRFMQTDPIGYGDGPNWYAYTHNDPINFVDPLGLQEDRGVTPHTGCNQGAGPCQGANQGSDIIVTGLRNILDVFRLTASDLRGKQAAYNQRALERGLDRTLSDRSSASDPDRKSSCAAPSNVSLTGTVIVVPAGPAYFSGTLRDVSTGQTYSVSGYGYGGGLVVGSYDVHATVRGFGALANGLDIAFAQGPYGSGAVSLTDNNGKSIGQGTVSGAVAPPIGAGMVSFDPPKVQQSNPGRC